MESTARVVLSARAGAPVVLSAGLDALVSPFLADEVGEGKRVFRYVGLQLVSADAAVGQGFWIAVVHQSGSGRCLLADQRARALLRCTPISSVGQGHTVGVDDIVSPDGRDEDDGRSQDTPYRRHCGVGIGIRCC